MSCGGTAVADLSLDGVDVAGSSIVQGTVRRTDGPVAGAYVRLLDAGGEFTAEVVTGEAGAFRFFARPGEWMLRVLSPAGSGTAQVEAAQGRVASADVELA